MPRRFASPVRGTDRLRQASHPTRAPHSTCAHLQDDLLRELGLQLRAQAGTGARAPSDGPSDARP
eukprot:7655190-Heterocapsa_arctica.AAC.1